VLAADGWPVIKSKSQRVLWSAPATQPGKPSPSRCCNPVFSPDGGSVVFFVQEPDGARLLWASADDGKEVESWKTNDAKAICVQAGFFADGKTVAAVVSFKEKGTPKASPALVMLSQSPLLTVPSDPLSARKSLMLHAPNLAFGDSAVSGKGAFAIATESGIGLMRPGGFPQPPDLLHGKATVEEPCPFRALAFSPDGMVLVAVGQVKPPFTQANEGPGVVVFLDDPAKPQRVDLPVSAAEFVVSADSKQIAAAVWTASPVGVERPGGLMVWNVADLRAGKVEGKFVMDPAKFICGVHTYPGGIFWLDGKLCCLATEIDPEPNQPYRRFGVWQVDAQAKEPVPHRLSIIGPMPKRMYPDPAGRGRIFWRYNADAGMFLLDERTGQCRRFDDKLNAKSGALTLSPDLKRLVIARDSELVLHELSMEEK
jgi:hypothetical protein